MYMRKNYLKSDLSLTFFFGSFSRRIGPSTDLCGLNSAINELQLGLTLCGALLIKTFPHGARKTRIYIHWPSVRGDQPAVATGSP